MDNHDYRQGWPNRLNESTRIGGGRNNMQVHQAATMQLESIGASAPVREAAEKMRSSNIGLLLVSEGDQLVGVVTDRDIVTRSVAAGSCICKATTKSIMSHPVVCVDSHADLDSAAQLMADKSVRRLVVLDERNVPVGVLSIDDLAFSTHGGEAAAHVLEELAHGPASTAKFRTG